MRISTAPRKAVIEKLPYLVDSADYFCAIRSMEWPIWLDSGGESSTRGRYDILSASPSKKLIQDQLGCRSETPAQGKHLATTTNFTSAWEALKREVPRRFAQQDLPFMGGAMGYLGYDLGRQIESLNNSIARDAEIPDLLMGIYDWAIIQDHSHQESHLVFCDELDELDEQTKTALRSRLHKIVPGSAQHNSFAATDFRANITHSEYHEKIERIKQYIQAGDCYQVNFAQRFSGQFEGDPLAAYRNLRQRLPSPFSCYFETEYGTILSVSPERFIQVSNRDVLTQPIKGTCRRGINETEDQQLAQALLGSDKNRAENLMIVDLLRNDLSKSCAPNSVKTPRLFNLESYANVHHLVSTVTGKLESHKNAAELLKECFPGGSITGAPKIRAMQVIEELEGNRRSAYCGSIGYLSFNGNMDTNIAIRTVIANDDRLLAWAGGGIVADSDAESEYQESLTKIGLILETLKSHTPAS